ncbi:MAG: hypothetical protein KJ884_19985 [Gammaproteobacteria bacterium]|uniref:YXWGXW repeat-containing protein n=1 Tax=Pseudomonas cuatrocienegasensis TaxID=543360 RepID=A0ABY1B3P2_9PSED|nr:MULTISPECIES: hypothetical protein [Pseudomonas]MBU1329077.1 hypothetical protein [Gammaproteobacteria bacterium]MBU1490350.1 hypothetical protein [Gammaproteobacteria bacterium]MBU2064651.1 hypothetical protein [Gammaproteobacteria bacterium]MBU2138649.1 hypothetical protein [Gammaproteobacteria bacterium]MBU2217003.1 hypothetical protein [Gammaproteobacteria bacterium]
MTSAKALVLIATLLGVAGCAVQAPTPEVPVPPASKSHPRFAPPPGVQSHWDGALTVYVIDGYPDLFYRERTYYRWDSGWYWSTQATGPWQATDSTAIPPGLYRRYAR